ncbi:MAG: preprotein translocase subunit SecE [Candidatus Uhrbacteria bacterium]|nr:preprotein translocase subunit SecE [Patescibacteria group bacterium]MBU1907056.1 preprotein translocase subunit SecE [Patescibacteria group bacterium]
MAKITQNILFRYVRESKQELAKVTWPSRKDTYRYTIIVVALSVAIGAFFFMLDWAFNQGLSALINL